MKKLAVAGLLILAVASCMKKATEPTPPQVADNVVLPEQDSSVTEVIVDSSRVILIFSSGFVPNIQVGDIIVGTSGLGYLRKVQAVRISNDTMYLTTEQASLSEVILSGEMDTLMAINPPSPRPQRIRIDTTIQTRSGTFRILETGDPVRFVPTRSTYVFKFPNLNITLRLPNGEIAAQIHLDTLKFIMNKEVDFHLRYDSGLREFRWILNSNDSLEFNGLTMELMADISGIDSIPIGPQPLFGKSVTIFFHGIPVVIYFKFYLSAGLDAFLSAEAEAQILGSYGISTHFAAGAEYEDGTWNTVWNKSLRGFSDINPNLSYSLSTHLEEFIKGKLRVLVYGVLGPGIWVDPYGYQEIQYPPFSYEIGVGIRGGLNFLISIFDHDIVNYSNELVDFHFPIAEGGGLAAPSLIYPPNNSVVRDTPVVFAWHQVPGAMAYQIQVDQDPEFASPEIDRVLEDTTNLVHHLFQETRYYWRVRAKDIQDQWGPWSDMFSFTFSSSGSSGSGWIVFDDNQGNIWRVKPDGTQLEQLTNSPYRDVEPDISPDGQWIVFSRRYGSDSCSLIKMKIDGTFQQPLITISYGRISSCSWFPDGNKIVMHIYYPDLNYANIYTINSDGTGFTQLTFDNEDEVYPSVNPSDGRIYFSKGQPNYRQIYSMNPDGSDLQLFLPGFYTDFGTPKWDPSGTKLIVQSRYYPHFYYIYDFSSNTVYELNPPEDSDEASWSPDGSQIVFDAGNDNDRNHLYIYSVSDSTYHIVGEFYGNRPVWGRTP